MLFHTVCKKNRTRVKRPIWLPCLCFFLMTLCPYSVRATVQNTAPQLQIYTAIAPLAFIIRQIGGPHLSVETLLPPGQDPHLFEPEPRLLQRLSKADMYLTSGLPFERMLIQKITARQGHVAIIDLTTKISFWESGRSHGGHDSSKKNTDAHDHSGRDPHFWLGVEQLRQFITAAAGSIGDADPGHASVYQKNTARLLDRLDSVHTQNLTLLQPYRNRIFFTYHPSFGYFARTYGLQQHTVESNGGKPGPRTIAALIKQARAAHVRTIFVQPQYDTKSAQTIATAIHGSIVPLDPLAKDVIENLSTMALIIAGSFEQKPVQK